ncbi:class E sortase [Kitasatospora sp. NPDC094015]|uniref:class E sortase n=1 Tax=Kitasatospora sp. NPDC094015 TaxID=3155205 RepID=UPI00332C69CC
MRRSRRLPTALATTAAGALVAVLAGCSAAGGGASAALAGSPTGPATAPASPTPAAAPVTAAPSTTAPSTTAPAADPRTRPATLSIPSIGLAGLPVVPYQGTTDDAPGTTIQDRGVAASPYGEHGGVGPGQVGNYLITGHRLSAGGPLGRLPAVQVGDVVEVSSDGLVYRYEITATRSTSFRSEQSLAEQRAAVPGSPGTAPTQAMITISTCATPEDNAAGDRWRDANGNPEHRIDKIGVLVGTPTPAPPS